MIQAIEKFGFENAFQAHSFLEDLVQTDETVRWLIQQLAKMGQPTNEKEAEPVLAYNAALVHADPAVLKNHEAEIMALESLDPDSKDAIRTNLVSVPICRRTLGRFGRILPGRMKTTSPSPTKILISVAGSWKPWAVIGNDTPTRFWR